MTHTLDRRDVLTAGGLMLLAPATGLLSLGTGLLSPATGRAAPARKTLNLELVARDLALRPDRPTPVWRSAGDAIPRFDQGDEVEVTIDNRLPVGVFIAWRGLLGGADVEPVLARGQVGSGESARYVLALRHAGTLVCDARLGGGAQPLPVLPIVVQENSPVGADYDETFLIEDWHLTDPAAKVFTVNSKRSFDLSTKCNQRLRLRLIGGSQRTVIAVKFDGLDVRVIAIDSQPAEPFSARDGRIVLAPGTRIDVLIDAATAGSFPIIVSDGDAASAVGTISVSQEAARASPLPPPEALPSKGLPAQLRLQTAFRVDVPLNAGGGWVTPSDLKVSTSTVFRVKRGRVVLMALMNPSEQTAIFHLHGHPMRLLDRLDDGWKPFWLDTVAMPGKQTLRVAFEATHSGAFLMEMTSTTGTSPTLVRNYLVEV